jgi:Uma2 family endonuclease
MNATTRPASPPPLLSLAGFKRFTAAQYHSLIHSGIIMEGEAVELLEGYLVEKGMRNPPHDMALRRLTVRLPRHVTGWFLQIQGAIALGESEPEPDGAFLRGDETACDGRSPTAADIGSVIEISDSTLAFDRRDKGRIYARVGIPVYWIVNVVDRHVEVYTDPDTATEPSRPRTASAATTSPATQFRSPSTANRPAPSRSANCCRSHSPASSPISSRRWPSLAFFVWR